MRFSESHLLAAHQLKHLTVFYLPNLQRHSAQKIRPQQFPPVCLRPRRSSRAFRKHRLFRSISAQHFRGQLGAQLHLRARKVEQGQL
jgi:hypothetical protein